MSRESTIYRIKRRLRPWAAAVADARERWFGQTPTVPRPRRVIFVCRGNICRSVFAEHALRRRLPDLEVGSAGIHVSVANPPPPTAVEVGREFGFDLSAHRSRSIRAVEPRAQTVYLVLEPWHQRDPAMLERVAAGGVYPLGAWASPRRAVIADPYGRDAAAFRRCFSIIERSIENLASRWDSERP